MRKSFYHFAIAAVAMAALTACGSSERPVIDAIPAQLTEDSGWGLLGPDGKMICSDEFDQIPSSAVNGFFHVAEDDGISVYTLEEHPKLVGNLEGLDQAGYYSCGLLPIVRPDSRIEVVDEKGETKFELGRHNGHEVTMCNPAFYDGLLVAVFDDDKWGAFDTSGNLAIEPKWDGLSFFSGGYSLALKIKDEENQFYVIDRKGEVKATLPLGFLPRRRVVVDGLIGGAIMRDDKERMAIVDMDGNVNLLPAKAKNIEDFGKDFVIFVDADGDLGIMNPDGDVCIRSKYDQIVHLDDRFLGVRGNKLYRLTLQGEETLIGSDLVPVISSPEVLSLFSSKFALKEVGSEEHLADIEGKPFGTEFFASEFISIDVEALHSRFVDYEGITNQLASLISAKGFDGVTLGSNLNDYFPDDETVAEHAGRTFLERYDDSKPEGCTMMITITSDQTAGYDTTPNAYFYTWERNPAAVVKEITAEIHFPYNPSSTAENNKPAEAARAALLKAGYKADGNVFTKGDTQCVLDPYNAAALRLVFTSLIPLNVPSVPVPDDAPVSDDVDGDI